jgi:site-specific DNA-methyltransferase (adenine-specific)
MKTRFFRFLVAQFMYSHHITKDSYSFVPILDMESEWSDEMLYKRYGLIKDEIAFIGSQVAEHASERFDEAVADDGDDE